MLRIGSVSLAALVLAAFAWSAFAQEDEARAVALKAQEVHGGKALRKFQSAQVKYKGELDFMNVKGKLTGEIAFQLPNKLNNTFTMEINNVNVDVVTVFDGKKLYVKAGGMNMELDDAKIIEETKESLYAEKVAALVDLEDEGYKFAPLGEVKVADKDAVGVRVSRKGQKDVNLYFDKKSHLLVKYEFRGKDPIAMMEVAQEKILSNYKAISGIQTAMKIEVLYDGKRGMEMEVTEARYSEKLDDSLFAKP